MYLYNSLSGKKEELKKPKGRPTRLFVCGPTVQDSSHIGHARTYISFDVIARFLRFLGHNLVYLENITNVDDKIIARAKEEGINPLRLALRYEREFHKMMQALEITSVDIFARASDYIPQIVSQIETLKKKGFAYEIKNDGWYFDVSRFKDYGKLSHRTGEEAEDSVSRIDESIAKRNKADFCLWKFVAVEKNARPFTQKIQSGEPAWQTSLGWGRPGWHIEDTAITEAFFGNQYELHGGGVDLKFPHHEAEIAQQEAASGKSPFVEFWMHTGGLLVEGKKMSKSLKNFITIEEFLGKNKKDWQKRKTILRLIILGSHYRSPIHFTKDSETQASHIFESFSFFMDAFAFMKENGNKTSKSSLKKVLKDIQTSFIREMKDDANTPGALAALFEGINTIKPNLFLLSKSEAEMAEKTFSELFGILGLFFKMTSIPSKINAIAKKRELYRVHKQFIKSDALRKNLHELGYEVNDTPRGPFVRKIQ